MLANTLTSTLPTGEGRGPEREQQPMWDGPPGWLSSPKRFSRWPPGGWHGLLDGIRLGPDGDSAE